MSEDIASLISFLASEKASWITGVNIVIGGGMITKMIYIDVDIISKSAEILASVSGVADALKKILLDPSKVAETLKVLSHRGLSSLTVEISTLITLITRMGSKENRLFSHILIIS
jgi:hypothetical protein